MSSQVKLRLTKLITGSYTPEEVRSIISGIPGVELAYLDPDNREALILINSRVSSPDGIMEKILNSGLMFKRYSVN